MCNVIGKNMRGDFYPLWSDHNDNIDGGNIDNRDNCDADCHLLHKDGDDNGNYSGLLIRLGLCYWWYQNNGYILIRERDNDW